MDNRSRVKRQTVGTEGLDVFLADIGVRVRDARAKRGMTRRILAADSGVSERYLANLEAGTANPSAAVLRQLAHAMDYPIGDFIPSTEAVNADMESAVACLRTLDPARIAEVEAMLAANFGADNGQARAGRIALIGLRGAGKSTLGQRVAEELGFAFVELNRLVEEDYGASVGELLSLAGQPAFRRHERRCLERVIETQGRAVIATGGGIVTEPETFAMLLRHCHCIWLKAKPDEHMSRVMAQGDLRPMEKNREALKDLKSIIEIRTPLYKRAAAQLDTSGRDEDFSARGLEALCRQFLG